MALTDRWCDVSEMSASSALKPSQTALGRDWWNTLRVRSITLWTPRDHAAFFAVRFVDPDEPREPKRVMRGGSFLCTEQYCSRYMVGTRGKGEVSTGTNHLRFRTAR